MRKREGGEGQVELKEEEGRKGTRVELAKESKMRRKCWTHLVSSESNNDVRVGLTLKLLHPSFGFIERSLQVVPEEQKEGRRKVSSPSSDL